MTVSVTLDRTSLSLAPLVITGSAPAGDGFFLTMGGLAEPAFDVRATYAPDSAYVAGSQLLAAVLTASTLPLGIGVKATTHAGLDTLKTELSNATWQFDYEVTLDVEGVTTTWDAGPCWPVWGQLTSGLVTAVLALANVVIPVNP